MEKRVFKIDGQEDLVVYTGKLAYASKLSLLNALKTRGIMEEVEGELVNAKGTHSIVELGNIVIEAGEYDANGNETKAPVFSDKYHADIMTEQEYDFGVNEVIIEAGQPVAHNWL